MELNVSGEIITSQFAKRGKSISQPCMTDLYFPIGSSDALPTIPPRLFNMAATNCPVYFSAKTARTSFGVRR
jgi:hypothetical protein